MTTAEIDWMDGSPTLDGRFADVAAADAALVEILERTGPIDAACRVTW
jgi:hypothetical protein